jgi:hypothetical protein
MKSRTILHLRIAVLSAGVRAHSGGPHGGTVGPHRRGADDGGLGQRIWGGGAVSSMVAAAFDLWKGSNSMIESKVLRSVQLLDFD